MCRSFAHKTFQHFGRVYSVGVTILTGLKYPLPIITFIHRPTCETYINAWKVFSIQSSDIESSFRELEHM